MVTNDGATILKSIALDNAAAKVLVKGVDVAHVNSSTEGDNGLVWALTKLRMKFRQSPPGAVTLDDFATVVRGVLIAWASQVPLIGFDDDQPVGNSNSRSTNEIAIGNGGTKFLRVSRRAGLEDISSGILG